MRRAATLAVIGGLFGGSLAVGLGVTGAGAGSPSTSAPAQELTVEVTPAAARPGETFTVVMTGCGGGEIAAGLWVPLAADPVVSTGPIPTSGGPVVGTLTVPVGAAATEAQVVVICSLDPGAFAVADVQILAAAPTTTAPAPAVGGQPTFTG